MQKFSSISGAPVPAYYDVKSFNRSIELALGEDQEGIEAASNAVHNIIEDEINSGIPSSKIVVGGYSQGAAMAIYTALTNKHDMGGMVAMSGYFPLHRLFPEAAADVNKDVEALMIHGKADRIASYEDVAIWSYELMKKFMTNLEFKAYEGDHLFGTEEILLVKNFLSSLFIKYL